MCSTINSQNKYKARQPWQPKRLRSSQPLLRRGSLRSLWIRRQLSIVCMMLLKNNNNMRQRTFYVWFMSLSWSIRCWAIIRVGGWWFYRYFEMPVGVWCIDGGQLTGEQISYHWIEDLFGGAPFVMLDWRERTLTDNQPDGNDLAIAIHVRMWLPNSEYILQYCWT